jgi:hypothetical protein
MSQSTRRCRHCGLCPESHWRSHVSHRVEGELRCPRSLTIYAPVRRGWHRNQHAKPDYREGNRIAEALAETKRGNRERLAERG